MLSLQRRTISLRRCRYGRIIDRICGQRSQASAIKARSVIAWVALAARPLRIDELLAGVSHGTFPYTLNERTKLPHSVLELAKPLIEIDNNGHVSFIHFTVKE